MWKLSRKITLVILITAIACTPEKSKEKPPREFLSNFHEVQIDTVKEGLFNLNINSNGKLEAIQKVDLKFENEGVIQKILVNNGSYVRKGQVIAYQNSVHLASEKEKNKEMLNQAVLNTEDLLLGFGYALKDSANVPVDILEMAKSRSRIAEAKNQISQTNHKIRAARIIAPFSGLVADLEAQEKSLSSLYDKVCTIIDNERLSAKFFILENDFGKMTIGDSVDVYPVAIPDEKFSGIVHTVNPIVDENGMILIEALVENRNRKLIDGMNVNVTVKKRLKKEIGIPKKAVVKRQGRDVVFTFENGKSLWKYVKLGYENRDSILVTEGLAPGDNLIINGNENLAHNVEVKISQ